MPEESVVTTDGAAYNDKSLAMPDMRYMNDVGHNAKEDPDGAPEEPDCTTGSECPKTTYANDLKNERGVYKDRYVNTGPGITGPEISNKTAYYL